MDMMEWAGSFPKYLPPPSLSCAVLGGSHSSSSAWMECRFYRPNSSPTVSRSLNISLCLGLKPHRSTFSSGSGSQSRLFPLLLSHRYIIVLLTLTHGFPSSPQCFSPTLIVSRSRRVSLAVPHLLHNCCQSCCRCITVRFTFPTAVSVLSSRLVAASLSITASVY